MTTTHLAPFALDNPFDVTIIGAVPAAAGFAFLVRAP